MYINPFVAGIAATLIFEFLGMCIFSVWNNSVEKEESEDKDNGN